MVTQEVRIAPRGAPAYSVFIGAGVRTRLEALLPAGLPGLALIADARVATLQGPPLRAALPARLRLIELSFPEGEVNKTRETKAKLEDAMITAGLGRDCWVLGLGGGVSTDLAGFVAATYLRGVPWIAMPTSLLGAVDASVGGKTGVDTPAGKNLIGAFHPPRAVLIDLDLLATLPTAEVDNGLAEMVKHALVADADQLQDLVANAVALRELVPEVLAQTLARSVAVKAAVVTEDPEEADRRQVLNAGHTIGHALELLSNYRMSHGHAVALGLLIEAAIAVRCGLCDPALPSQLRHALLALGLPVTLPADVDPPAVLRATRGDKKSRAGQVRYALPSALGHMHRGPTGWATPVEDAIVLDALEEATA